ncbi:hypothetical protein [Streptosporangium carneum]|uniref:Uncharacterized protein n=1 Tax=Streptosporangium carneum TaxID=47481 RepID=A0A9W6IBC1_9ACTN|nr:hypothetical protein [Streptosporangium carneum]GLK14345.1 hypothetical protein GCM10017600_77570 [Streptosporangium carneum]
MTRSRRIALLGADADFVAEMADLSVRGLPPGYVDGEFVFTRRGSKAADGSWRALPEGRSVRYTAIVALGLATLTASEPARVREALAGDELSTLVGRLVERLPGITGVGDVALICWAAAETGHEGLPEAIRRLAEVDGRDAAAEIATVEASWAVAGLAAARDAGADVAEHYERARARLLAGIGAGGLYPHVLGTTSPWYRGHVGCFADQVYPIQALARAGDADAVAVADRVAAGICAAQGEAGQWWWHYDSRTGAVVEGYPVYSVHQLAMAPMALLDLADAGGRLWLDEIVLGLRWMHERPETDEAMVIPELDLTWRKAAREDPKKIVRGARAAATRLRAGARLGVLDRVYPPVAVDRECRPYELGWLLYAWLYGGA